jgi:hypothetical protein
MRFTGSAYPLTPFTANHPTAIPMAKVTLNSNASRLMVSSSEASITAS